MTILLDFDGVLITTPPWKPIELSGDGFIAFNQTATTNLLLLILATPACDIVLTTTHRISYNIPHWENLFAKRGLKATTLSVINQASTINEMKPRKEEIADWYIKNNKPADFIILDDDTRLNDLEPSIKKHWIQTLPLVGLDDVKANEALELIKSLSTTY